MSDKTNIKILIVDDEVQLLELLKMEFEEYGFQVYVAENVDNAIEILDKEELKLILSDLKMPARSGKDLLNYTKENYPKVRFLFMSGFSEAGDEDVAQAEYFFQKPFSLQTVVNQVKSMLLPST